MRGLAGSHSGVSNSTMTDLQLTQPRALVPRRLDQKESLNSLNHWAATFKNYYRRCQYYGHFLQPGLTWTSDGDRGLQAETTGLKRTPSVLASDLEGFLQCLGGYLPFDYVSEKLNSESTSLQSAWDIIYEIYDVEINTTHFLDYATMVKDPQETYRGFFNRLVGFVRQHLPREKFEAEGIKCSSSGEILTIGLLDAITIHWLNSIDRRLIKIIKTEFSTQLKTKRICQMIKSIAPNIDELLCRYNQQDSTNEIAAISPSPQAQTIASATPTDTSVDMIIRRLERLENNTRSANPSRGFRKWNEKSTNRPKIHCGHCAFINRQLGASLDTSALGRPFQ